MRSISRLALVFPVVGFALASCSDDKMMMKDGGGFSSDAFGGEKPADLPVTDIPREPSPDYPGRSFTDVYGIFGDKTGVFGCAGATCHLSSDTEEVTSYGGDLHMNNPVTACSDLVNVSVTEAPGKFRVKPGSLDESYLWCKMTSTSCGVQEPRKGKNPPPLDKFYLDVIQSWIENGAHCPN